MKDLISVIIFIIISVFLCLIFSYYGLYQKHDILITPSQLQLIEQSCNKNNGLSSVLFYRTPTTLGAKTQCKDSATFIINFLDKNDK